ncbi:MAG: hypothetical protein CMK07_02940 [Ponticaulis sp.]|nr:hypothetical protein [Ponticaulis sp.]
MKSVFLSTALFALVSAPALAQSASIEVKLPAQPTSAQDIVDAHEKILAAAKDVCSKQSYEFSYLRSRAQAEKFCVRQSYEAAVKNGRDAQFAVFLDESALEGTEFE